MIRRLAARLGLELAFTLEDARYLLHRARGTHGT
jgi:hypothetical protein